MVERKMSVVGSEDGEYPPKDILWPGCLLASIAHAVFVVRAPFLEHEHSWDGQNYSVQNTQGSRGTIAFGEDRDLFVAVAQSLEHERARSDTQTLFRDIPDDIKGLRDEALQYVMEDVQGVAVPMITAAFWSDLKTSRVTGCEPWRDVLEHGARIFERQFCKPDISLARWATDCGFDENEIALTQALFQRRLAATGAIRLSNSEIGLLHQKSRNSKGLQACRNSLSQIGIVFP